jgi:putative Mn2+ efflux pump MntP
VPGLVPLLLVSVSVGLSNFAGAIGIGLSGIDARTRIRVGVAFGIFEALMPIIGLLVGQAVAGYLGHLAKYIGGAILILTGAYTIWQGRRVESEQQSVEPIPDAALARKARTPLRTRRLLVTALALSIDNLAVGFALGNLRISIVFAAVTMGVVSVAMSLIGLELGHRLGVHVEAWSEEIGGVVLIGVGVAIAAGFLG